MKRFALLALVASLVTGFSLFFAGCGKDEEKKTTSSTTTISNNTQGTQAASSTSQNVDTAMNSGDSFDSLGSIGLSSTVGAPELKFANTLSAKAPTTHTCSEGGAYTFDGTANKATLSASGDFVFTDCIMEGKTFNGPMHLEATSSLGVTSSTVTMAMTLGSTGQFSITDNGRVSTMSSFALTVERQYSNLNQTFSNSRTIKASGSMNVTDGTKTVTTTFSNDFTQAVENNISGDVGTKTITTSGTITEAGPVRTVTTSFSNFEMKFDVTASNTDISINGTFTIASGSCFDGTFTLVTNTPIRIDSTGTTIAGQIVINGATTMTFNADGSVTVNTGGESQTYTSIDDVDVCPL
jgi:hypothetical protein